MPKKKHKHAFRKATDRLESEGRRQCALLYGSTAIALNRHWKKGKDAIVRLFDVSGEIWQDCAATNMHSMIEMCEEETGIEIQNGEDRIREECFKLTGIDVADSTTKPRREDP